MSGLDPIVHDDEVVGYSFRCPGCESFERKHLIPRHTIWVKQVRGSGPHATWDFNGDLEKPTFSPSIGCHRNWWNPETERYDDDLYCHSYLRDGVLEFLPDSTHKLAGQKVPLH